MKGTRKNKKGSTGFVGKIYSPVKHLLNATGNSIKEVSYYAGNVASRTIKGAKKLGKVWTNHANATIRNLTNARKKGSKGKKATRKSRK